MRATHHGTAPIARAGALAERIADTWEQVAEVNIMTITILIIIMRVAARLRKMAADSSATSPSRAPLLQRHTILARSKMHEADERATIKSSKRRDPASPIEEGKARHIHQF